MLHGKQVFARPMALSGPARWPHRLDQDKEQYLQNESAATG